MGTEQGGVSATPTIPLDDRAAFEALFARHSTRLLLWIERTGGIALQADSSAEDLLQETAMHAYRAMRTFEHRSSAATYRWLATVAENVIANRVQYVRAKGRDRAMHFGSLVVDSSSRTDPPASSTSPSRGAARREDIERLRRALGQLPAHLREVVELQALAGLSLAEIAARIGVAKTTVFDRLDCAMDRLRVILGGAL